MSNINWLFATSAVKIAPSDSQFWYTSGLIGPYYINAQYLCGGEATALSVLKLIDEKAEDYKNFPEILTNRLLEVYEIDTSYRELVDELADKISTLVKSEGITYVSGGQRRDWFFSPIIAKQLNIPCLYIYNDLKVFNQEGQQVKDLKDAKVINVADLLTVGSSYTDKWIPALKAVNASLVASANIVDRSQGGKANLESAGIKNNITLFTINQSFFDQALKQNYVDAGQHKILTNYFNNQDSAMKNWLMENPDFLKKALASSDPKTQARAKNLVEKDLYGLKG